MLPPQPELLSFFTTWFPLRRLHFSMPTIADPAFTLEAAPSAPISQHSYSMNKHNNTLPLQRSSRSRGHRDCDFTAPAYSRGSTSNADGGETAPNNQNRQRQTSVTGSIAERLEGSDPRGTSVPSMEIVSNREASSQAWVQRQRIDTREGKTSTVNTDKGRFTAEYGKPVGFSKLVPPLKAMFLVRQRYLLQSRKLIWKEASEIWPKALSLLTCDIQPRE